MEGIIAWDLLKKTSCDLLNLDQDLWSWDLPYETLCDLLKETSFNPVFFKHFFDNAPPQRLKHPAALYTLISMPPYTLISMPSETLSSMPPHTLNNE